MTEYVDPIVWTARVITQGMRQQQRRERRERVVRWLLIAAMACALYGASQGLVARLATVLS